MHGLDDTRGVGFDFSTLCSLFISFSVLSNFWNLRCDHVKKPVKI